MLDALSTPFSALGELERVKDEIKKGACNIQITGCIDSGLVHMMKLVSDDSNRSCKATTNNKKIILTFSEQKASEIYEDMKFFDKSTYYYPSKDFIFYSAGFKGKQIVTERMRVLKAIIEQEPATIITTLDSLMDKLAPLSIIKDSSIVIDYDSIIDLEAFTIKLVSMGYEKVDQVEMPGQFAVRGSILDIYSLIDELPFRIDLWDDTIDSIKSFDPQSQRTVENLELITIYPATEFILSKKRLVEGMEKIRNEAKEYSDKLRKDMKTEEAHRISTTINELLDSLEYAPASVTIDSYVNYFYEEPVSLMDYFPMDKSIFLLDEPTRILEHSQAIFEEYRESMISRLEKGYLLPKEADAVWDYNKILTKITKYNVISFTTLDQKLKMINPKETFHMSMRGINPYNSSFETLIKDLNHYKSKGFTVVILSASKTRAMRLADDLLNEYGLNAFYSDSKEATCTSGQILVTYGNLHKGFEYPSIKFALIAETDIFGTIKKKKKKTAKYSGQKIASFSDLAINDYVVHENHGLGIYRGIEKITVDKTVKDYIKIEYASKGNLYIPVTQLDMIQKYASGEAKAPKLNKLGTPEWNKTKSRVRAAVKDIAADLVKLYASRQSKDGYIFDKDTLWQTEFEEMFPFDETEDQLTAIEETKRDMESRKIMDRLICGDVGFG